MGNKCRHPLSRQPAAHPHPGNIPQRLHILSRRSTHRRYQLQDGRIVYNILVGEN